GEQMVSQFSYADERLWHVGYDFDFVDVGVPGLKFTFRYVSADHVDPTHMSGSEARELRARGARGNEWERYNEIAYVVQSGPLKNL
ncbi:OprD family outer membrane porin, partial [Azotobacter beijerinckii]|nr:OprD family outer membrane porin [Azotobacter beijerinckii]